MKKLFVSLLAVSFLLSGCGGFTGKNTIFSQEMRRIEAGELLSSDISLATDSTSHTAIYNTYEGLYRQGKENELILAGAAAKAVISEDGLTYKFKLNEKAKWSDGKPVTAKDYVFSWRRTVDPVTASEYASVFLPVKNAKKIMSDELEVKDLGIHAKSDYEIIIELEAPTPYFESLLALPNFFPQREDIVNKFGDEYATTSEKAVYNGAFVLSDCDLTSGGASEWSYKKNDQYWDKEKVKLEKIENVTVKDMGTAFSMYENGEVDETYLLGEYVRQNLSSKETKTILKPSTYYIQYNLDDPILSRKAVRVALAASTDRNVIVDKILANGSRATTSFVPQDLYYNPITHEDFSDTVEIQDTSDQLEKRDIFENGDNVELELLIPEDDGIKKIAEYLQEEYQNQIEGLVVKITPVPVQTYMERINAGDFSMSIFGWKADYPDPTTFLNNLESESPFNFGKYSNSEYNDLLDKVNEDGMLNWINVNKVDTKRAST